MCSHDRAFNQPGTYSKLTPKLYCTHRSLWILVGSHNNVTQLCTYKLLALNFEASFEVGTVGSKNGTHLYFFHHLLAKGANFSRHSDGHVLRAAVLAADAIESSGPILHITAV